MNKRQRKKFEIKGQYKKYQLLDHFRFIRNCDDIHRLDAILHVFHNGSGKVYRMDKFSNIDITMTNKSTSTETCLNESYAGTVCVVKTGFITIVDERGKCYEM